jgi:blue copper oxidase
MVAHPFHIHDVQFYVLDRDGNLPPLNERGRKDVVLINPNETVRFITKFEDFADSLNPYMYHCHVLMHEDDGMMGQFIVKPASGVGIKKFKLNDVMIKVYPNPVSDMMNIDINEIDQTQPLQLAIYDVLGKIVYASSISQMQSAINTSHWSKGIYTISLSQNQNSIHKKIIIQ